MTYIVYTEIFLDEVERYFFGEYPDRNRANAVAEHLNDIKGDDDKFYCVCSREVAEEMGVRNLPR